VIAYLNRYYAFGLVLALIAPFWLNAISSDAASSAPARRDALIWTGVLLGSWLLVSHRRYQIRGRWRRPTQKEVKLYIRFLLGVLLVDFGSKALFFRWDRPQQVEIITNFGLHSVFHQTSFEPFFHLLLLLYFSYLFLVGALFFRFSNKHLDRVWLISSPFALGAALALVGERFIFGGVHNSFYFAGWLMWLCPTCAAPHLISYAWTPADFFVRAVIMPPIILLVSYLVPVRAADHASD
jgi:hypothetical protein